MKKYDKIKTDDYFRHLHCDVEVNGIHIFSEVEYHHDPNAISFLKLKQRINAECAEMVRYIPQLSGHVTAKYIDLLITPSNRAGEVRKYTITYVHKSDNH